MQRFTFYVEDFPDMSADTQITITVPRNAGRRFAVDIDLPVQPLSQLSPQKSLSQVGQMYSPNAMSAVQSVSQSASLSQSPRDVRFSPRQMTPQSSRTSFGETSFDASQSVSPQSPLYYSPAPPSPPSMSSSMSPLVSPQLSPRRQPTLMEAMQQTPGPSYQAPSPPFSPIGRVSPGYFGGSPTDNLGNFSPYGLSDTSTSPRLSPNYSSASPCMSPYVGGQPNRLTPQEPSMRVDGYSWTPTKNY